jgi:hypothetical protein
VTASGARPCFYFPRITVDEDRSYFGGDEWVIEVLANAAGDVPGIRDIARAFDECLGIDMFDAARSFSQADFQGGRALQVGLYAAAACLLEQRFAIGPSCVGCYSAGVSPAFICAGVFTMADYLDRITPFHTENRSRLFSAARNTQLRQALIEGVPEEDDVESFAAECITSLALSGRVYFKDRRHQHTIVLGGVEADLAAVCQRLTDRFPAVARTGVTLYPASSAHLPFYTRDGLAEMLADVEFRPPRLPVIGPNGEHALPLASDAGALRRMYADAVISPLDTGRSVRAISTCADAIYVVGTKRGGKVLAHTEIGGFAQAVPLGSLVQRELSSARRRGMTPLLSTGR